MSHPIPQSQPVLEIFQGSLLAHRELWQVVLKNRYRKTCFLAETGGNQRIRALFRQIGVRLNQRGWSVYTWTPITGVRGSMQKQP